MRMSEFSKTYNPHDFESKLYAEWEEKWYFEPRPSTTGKTFYIPIPPPNVTGNLHIGHSVTLTLEDIMTRYHRMCGDETLWVPGTDHAGIATQAKVEQRLAKEGKKRQDMERKEFIDEVWKWKNEYGGNIGNQFRKMGASVDWTKERFTLDEKLNKIVENTFVDLYNKGLIYRGEYMVNYSPVLESVISDIEVDYKEVEEKMYYITYFVSGSDNELLIATTRPETLLADQAVAVHPKDKRYKKLIGRSVILPIVNKEIPIIADPMVDMDFWTGVVKITPAHDPADFETAKRHNIRTDYAVIDKKWIMTKEAGSFAGQVAAEEARNNIVELLRAKWNLVKIEPYTHKVGFCSRGFCRIETIISTQWFVRASKMAEKVIAGYKKKEFEIIPDRFNKTFEDWIFNLRDWCISRQLWWGHQIPAYYHKETWELLGVTTNPAELYSKHGEENVRRDDDVLDTWYSSGLWPFSILDWNMEDPGELFKKFYPANVLETGHDIIFFWVIRMLLMGYEYTNQTPFKTIYLHGLVFDETGRKMSKSWGNVVDPIEVIEKYSSDALRLSCVLGNTPGNNLNFSMRNVEEYSLFLNKFWNIARFVSMNIGTIEKSDSEIAEILKANKRSLLPYEKWILSRMSYITKQVTQGMDDYTFAQAGSELFTFIRDEFADFAIEAYKITKDKSKFGKETLSYCLLTILKLAHPYIPFITEALYKNITTDETIILSSWPKCDFSRDTELEVHMNVIFDIVRSVRNIRARSQIKPGELREIRILPALSSDEFLEKNLDLIAWLAKGNASIIEDKITDSSWSYDVVKNIDVYVDTHIDQDEIEGERTRLKEQIEDKKEYIRILNVKLMNQNFVANAPEKVVRAEMEKKKQAEDQLVKLEEKYASL